jgi:hypothetical protein
LLTVLAVGVAVFAAVGQLESPSGVAPAAWVDNLIAATTAAGSAQVHFSTKTTSADASLDETSAGSGVVDFVNGNFRLTELYHQRESVSTNGGPVRQLEETWGQHTIAIGQTVYERLILPVSAPFSGWSRSHFPRKVHAAFGLDAATGAEDAVAGLASLAPVAGVRELGLGSVGGVATTRYLITAQPLYLCGKHGRTVTLHLVPATTVWVDGEGRLLQARVSDYNKGGTFPPPSRSGSPTVFPPSTTVSTMTFSELGVPVHIVAPPVNGKGGGSFSIATMENKARTTPCPR